MRRARLVGDDRGPLKAPPPTPEARYARAGRPDGAAPPLLAVRDDGRDDCVIVFRTGFCVGFFSVVLCFCDGFE